MKCFTAASIALLIVTPALAQMEPETGTPAPSATTAPAPSAAPAAAPTKFLTTEEQDQWLVGRLWNRNVYNAAGKPIGDLKDVLIGRDGKVAAVIVGVGGFLGMGEKNVAVGYDHLIQNGSISPNRIVLNMSEQDLRAAPEFKRTPSPGKR
ncbi:MAG: PRC-barrel domain-containing protein [Rhodomicrobium sp.]|nr:PRC-barrel domain-containing protein [Rhodomicrobium sp.]